MQKAQIPCHHINYNLQYRPANILWQQNEIMPCNDTYNRKIVKLRVQFFHFNEKYKKRHTKSPQGDKLHQFIQSIYRYNRRATNSRQRPNSLNLRRRGPFTWIYISIEIFHVIGRYYFSMSKEPNQPNKTSPAKPARQIPESSGIQTCYSSINTVVKVKSNPLNPIKSHYIKK